MKEALPGNAPVHAGPAHRVCFSPDGASVASCGTADSSARALRFPVSRFGEDGASLWAGHSAAVQSVCWSACSSRALTASSDGTAKLWAAGRADPLLTFSHLWRPPVAGDPPLGRAASAGGAGGGSLASAAGRGPSLSGRGGPASSSSSLAAAKPNVPLGSKVQAARFFQRDRVVVLGCGPKVLFYGYDLASLGAQTDLRRARVRAINLTDDHLIYRCADGCAMCNGGDRTDTTIWRLPQDEPSYRLLLSCATSAQQARQSGRHRLSLLHQQMMFLNTASRVLV